MDSADFIRMRMMGVLMALGLMNTSCSGKPEEPGEEADWARERQAMVDVLTARYQVHNARILDAMRKIRRHVFIPQPFRHHHEAYGDHPAPIGYNQTISQPFIVATMTEKLELEPGEKILEIGTGSGYQAAVLAEMGLQVYSVEIIPELARHASEVLSHEGYSHAVHVMNGDGYRGWPEHAPYDAIIVTCAPEKVPDELVNQLKEGGRIILPVGEWMNQRLVILRKTALGINMTEDLPVRFVPMVREK